MISVITHRRLALGLIATALLSASIAQGEPLSGSHSSVVATKGRSLAVREKDGIGIQVAQGNGSDFVSIQLGNENPKYEVTKLSNPPRLVVDLKSDKIRSNKNLAIADLEHVSGIRLGSRASSGRVVLDLTQGANIAHDIQVSGNSIIVSLRDAGASPSNVSALVEPRLPEGDDVVTSDTTSSAKLNVAPSQVSESSNRVEPQVVIENVADTKEAPSLRSAREIVEEDEVEAPVVDAAVLPVSASTSQSVAHVKSVKLNATEGSLSAVTLDVDGKPEFSITRTAPSEYVLTLKETTLSDSALSSTLFSESKTAGIRSVRSTTNGSDALVRIFAQPQTYLTARLAGSRVVVEETADIHQVVDDMRAQLAPKGAQKDAPTKEAPKSKEATKSKDSGKSKDVPVAKDVKLDKEAPKASPAEPSVAAKVEPSAAKSDDLGEMTDSEVRSLLGDTARYTGKLISLDLQDTDIDNALRIIAEVSNLNIVASEDVVGKVTLRLTDVPWDQALDVILKTHGLDKVLEGNVMRIAPVDKLRVERESLKQAQVAEAELEPLSVRYMRVSYGRASELKTLAEAVLSERGSVAYDERSNQIIVKDIASGIKNVTELVSKVDLRTPQVLLETQIVEASRNLSRQLGSELGFQYIQSPATGNGTGLNFPAAISIGGSAITQAATGGTAGAVSSAANITGSAFPVSSSAIEGSALTMLFDSADGTKTLELRLSQLEQEGRVRIVSRPAVATTNNKPAEIKSVEKYRVKLPNGGTSVATGAGASAAGSGGNATEVIEAGIVLNVTPQASPDYYILLDIKAKSSSFGSKNVDGIPNEIERSASSSVLVSSGQTFALGGIYKINEADRITGVPFFKDIPFLGTFFRRSQTDNSDEELLFFITPRIVEGSFDDATMKAAS
jgi:type IV pilus assembly protein PilQ